MPRSPQFLVSGPTRARLPAAAPSPKNSSNNNNYDTVGPGDICRRFFVVRFPLRLLYAANGQPETVNLSRSHTCVLWSLALSLTNRLSVTRPLLFCRVRNNKVCTPFAHYRRVFKIIITVIHMYTH